ncbi:MAG: hypothetical protein BWK80_53845 [Desulfobacteraceae bacterium IS3]|nr:MAG: hypothetical protein BWK80_53845 [Desulfobacteraceae bacterium IS3]
MPLRICHQEFRLLRDFVEQESGVSLGEDKAYLIENRLSKLAAESGCKTFGEFYLRLTASPLYDKLRASVIDAITTHETLWFRDRLPFKILEEQILPEFHKEIRAGKRGTVKIWSAACATGQEPYSIAMAALDFYIKNGYTETACCRQTQILATDISAGTLSFATAGKYDDNSISRGLPRFYLERYFQKTGNEWVLDDRIKNMVTFRLFNLKDPASGIIGPFDIIFLRNVIIYFSETFKKMLLSRIARILNPGGYLFVGTGETVGGYSDAFSLLEVEGTVFYRLKN